jgi:endonuclease III
MSRYTETMMNSGNEKRPFDIDVALEQIEAAIQPYPKAALFELAEDGFISPFEQLVACMISIRTRDETTVPVARKLFDRSRTPAEMVKLTPKQIEGLIREASFHESKSHQIYTIAQRLLDEHDGELPCDYDVMTSFKGVGPKCANLVLGVSCEDRRIGVDIHVHRVTNRWGYVQTTTPEKTTDALEDRLPHHYWIALNRLLVPFGKHICTGKSPKCSTCPVEDMCQQVEVTSHR